ncbi:hypothetical protein FWF74_01805 [Candidatus Saccharibacteria bacterium]|nr:hypothetical protein [Candidatus Saccharibacteria bacterium]MCL1963083.1 hypothetical protein [Candidatus Saccharibacteria bacterium]
MQPTIENHNPFPHQPQPPVAHAHVKKKKLDLVHYRKWIIPAAVVVIVDMVVVLVLMISNTMYFGLKSPSEKVVVRQTACDALVDEYVEAIGKDNTDEMGVVRKFAKKVPQTSAAESDATCQYIKFIGAFYSSDGENALKHAEKIKSLVDEGLYIDNRLPVFSSVDMMTSSAKAISKGAYKVTPTSGLDNGND